MKIEVTIASNHIDNIVSHNLLSSQVLTLGSGISFKAWYHPLNLLIELIPNRKSLGSKSNNELQNLQLECEPHLDIIDFWEIVQQNIMVSI